MIKSFKIFESPDNIYDGDVKLANWEDSDAYAIGYDKGKDFFIAPGSHWSRRSYEYDGRIWKDKKLITFWNYPESNKKLKEIIFDIESNFRENIWGKGWKIELKDGDLIPLEDYEMSKNRDKEEKQLHTLSPMYKNKKPKGWKPKNVPSLDIRQKMYQESINNSEIKLKEWILLNPEEFNTPQIANDPHHIYFKKFVTKTPAKFIRIDIEDGNWKYVFQFLNKPEIGEKERIYGTLWSYYFSPMKYDKINREENAVYIWANHTTINKWIDYHDTDLNKVLLQVHANKYNL